MEINYKLGDKVMMKKPHACKNNEWLITRVGVDIKIKCIACGREIMKSESQLGMSTVSTWYSSVDGNNAPYLYTDIETEDLIGVNYQDAGTSHIPKVVRASRRRWKLLR